ncbi:MAG: Rpn family recombination-promoting nuclease/putative transposase [Prevotellaceae bacterium]|jgi:predicted transposase/invertase (TIGR01784 family)|nr:Rpn family recombination-promoting nuclease/putative transposase [Prevotellaceae bacterium]
MGRYLDPKNDLPFKRIFGEHPELLKSFLNALMPFEKGQYIKSLEYLPPELVPNNPAKKNSIVDVRCKDNRGRLFIVEMQMYWSKYFSNRMVFNASKAYVRQLNKNEEYDLLQPVYALGIVDEAFDKKTPEYYHHYKIVNCKNGDDVIEGLEFVMIELPKFTPTSITEKKMAVLWLRFLNEIEDDKHIEPAPELMKNKHIRQAIELCEEGAFTEEELAEYEQYWDDVRIEKSTRNSSLREGEQLGITKGIEIGKAEGIEIGKVEGIEIGKVEGIEIGKVEGIEIGKVEGIEIGKVEGIEIGEKLGIEHTVVKGFKNGVSLDIISTITGLSNDEINTILKKHELIN